jgi:hypothetical protein
MEEINLYGQHGKSPGLTPDAIAFPVRQLGIEPWGQRLRSVHSRGRLSPESGMASRCSVDDVSCAWDCREAAPSGRPSGESATLESGHGNLSPPLERKAACWRKQFI